MRDVIGFPKYKVTEDGVVISFARKKQRIISGTPGEYGHLRLSLRKDGVTHRIYVHQVVLEAFVGYCPSGMECRHLDGNPKNNRLDNLKWGTSAENSSDSSLHGTMYKPVGEKHHSAKLTEEIVFVIRNGVAAGESRRSIANKYGVHERTISKIVNGETWIHLTQDRESD